MIVGTVELDIARLKDVVLNGEDIILYADSLVPEWARHISGIVDNQRYYVALRLRTLNSIPYKVRKPVIDKLIKDVRLIGVANSICTIYDIIDMADKKALIEALEWSNE